MNLDEFVGGIAGFADWKHAERIRFFGWFLQKQRKQESFSASELGNCYDEVHLPRPSSISPFLTDMEERKTLIRVSGSNGVRYKLSRPLRDELEKAFGARDITVAVDKLLTDLPALLPDLKERDYLEEALRCFRAQAFRATMVMVWNLTYDHLCEWILAKHLSEFNSKIAVKYPNSKKLPQSVARREDFTEFKEREVIEIANVAALLPNMFNNLVTKLDDRNRAAHPSGVKVDQLMAEAYVSDLINNVVLKLI